MKTRNAAVAGMFYPSSSQTLRQSVEHFLRHAQTPENTQPPVALVVPHAGYIYSGQVAANGFIALGARSKTIKRVILLGPNHRVPLRGIAAPSVDAFATPLGDIAIDHATIEALAAAGLVTVDDLPHRDEHCLEVQLPFLQILLENWKLVPLVVGQTPADVVAQLIARFIDDPENLVLISSDLSHFHDYDRARQIDDATRELIESRQPVIAGEQACGCQPLNGLLLLARQRDYTLVTLDMKNSGDTAGDRQRVVGYGSYAAYKNTGACS